MSKKTKTEDNPVPSLNNALEKTLKVVGDPRWFDDYKYGFSEGAKYLAETLENGVETDNGQPKCKNCKCNLKQVDDICWECGYDQGQ